MKSFIILVFSIFLPVICVCQQAKFTGHSHNDYYQQRPFYTAWENYFASVEADVWAVDGKLFIAHDRHEITPERTLENLYLKPIGMVFKENEGRAWKNEDRSFILMIDLKTSYDPTLNILIGLLEDYRHLIDPAMNNYAVNIVISGSMPPPGEFENYPSWISFDGRMQNNYTTKQLERVFLFSNYFGDYTKWNGKGNIPPRGKTKLLKYIEKAKSYGKPVRFWATPDNPNAWVKLQELGVDFINTDMPETYFNYMMKFK